MITLQDVQNRKLSVFSPKAMSGEIIFEVALKEYLQWLLDNHEYMDDKAKAYVDQTYDRLSKFIGEKIEGLPESKEKDAFSRIYKIGAGKHYSVEQLLRQLESKPTDLDELTSEAESLTLIGLQDTSDFILDIRENTHQGEHLITCISLLYACIDEALAALHLARHNFYVQANAHLRTILETVDKVKLFLIKPELIDVWTSGDYKLKNKYLTPSAVRKTLGLEKRDEFYEFLSEHGTHPTFRSFQSRTVMANSQEPKKQVQIYVAGTPFEHLRVWFYSSSLRVISIVLLQVIEMGKEILREDEIDEALDRQFKINNAFSEKYYITWLEKEGMDSSELKELLATKWNDYYAADNDDTT